jgi:outer membrane PBP1 activator LpoA protein
MLEETTRAAADTANASLAEAERLLASDDAVGATAALSLTDARVLPPPGRARAALLGAELARRTGDPEHAQELLSGIERADATTKLLAQALRITLERDPASGARTLMVAAVDAGSRPRVHDFLWSLLEETDPLLALAENTRGSPNEQGWWQLRLTTAMSLTAADRAARVRRWV